MYRHLFRFAVTTLTILTVNLITSKVSDLLISQRWETKPLRFSLIAMAIITLIFYPLFLKMEAWLNQLTRRFVKAGHSVVGRFFGLLAMFVAGLVILLYFYVEMWYGINIFSHLFNGTLFRLF